MSAYITLREEHAQLMPLIAESAVAAARLVESQARQWYPAVVMCRTASAGQASTFLRRKQLQAETWAALAA